jgi:MSHA biogenesis protein MshK
VHNAYSKLTLSALLLIAPLLTNGAESLRDPTRPYSARPLVSANAVAFTVSAVFVSSERRVAIVNGRRVTEGDRVDGAIVVKILLDSVRLDINGKQLTTKLLPVGLRN